MGFRPSVGVQPRLIITASEYRPEALVPRGTEQLQDHIQSVLLVASSDVLEVLTMFRWLHRLGIFRVPDLVAEGEGQRCQGVPVGCAYYKEHGTIL